MEQLPHIQTSILEATPQICRAQLKLKVCLLTFSFFEDIFNCKSLKNDFQSYINMTEEVRCFTEGLFPREFFASKNIIKA